MNNTGLSSEDLKQIKRALNSFKGIEEVYLFGSRAKGNFKKGSDIDLAIKFNQPDHISIQTIHDRLEEELPLPYFFDLLDLDAIENPELIDHIRRVGVPLSRL